MVDKTKIHLLMELTESVSQAASCAAGLAQLSGNPAGFLIIKDSLELMKEGVLAVASRSTIIAPKRVAQ
jgi:hypothetical protein